ncbi:glycoside hydrolase family 127 protein [Weissella paramesenteroides]|uniref:hypothetical protein n=1 Tax=Weissella paramesenteroides TaxID=1249 RepID=UPI003982570C
MYYQDGNDIYVSQYFDSILNLQERGLKIIQDADYPNQHFAHITVSADTKQNFTLYVRIPSWSPRTIIKIDGKEIEADPENGFVAINHNWQNSSEVTIDFDFELHYEILADRFNRMAVYYGPILLAAQTKDLPAATVNASEYLDKLVKVEGQNQFRLVGTDIIFKSLPEIPANTPYNVYVKVLDEPIVELLDSQTNSDDHQWTLAVASEKKNYLKITYNRIDGDIYSFQIKDDQQVLFTQTIDSNEWPEDSYYIYPLPEQVTNGRDKLNVQIQSLDYEGLNFDIADISKIETLATI